MKYRLKDAILQKKLDELSNGELSRNLAEHSGRTTSCRVFITADLLEPDGEFDPNGWNDFPAVRPPEGIPMCVEGVKGLGITTYFRGYFLNGKWYVAPSSSFSSALDENDVSVKRFRPWE